MITNTAKSHAFEREYIDTSYNVSGVGADIVLRIGGSSVELDDLLQVSGVEDWALITAWNPQSILRSDEENNSTRTPHC